MYDLIGDVHGHYEPLVQMLETLGYDRRRGVYTHPRRKVIFVGDWVDRGPRIPEVLRLVRAMVEHGSACAVQGNHEWNAIAYHTRRLGDSEFFRRHLLKNVTQHYETLQQFEPGELYEFIEWFKTLPLWLDLDGLRVVHACWDAQAMSLIQSEIERLGLFTNDFLDEAWTVDTPLFEACETILKGKELPLPGGRTILDKDGHPRKRVRTRWFDSPAGLSFTEYALPAHADHPELREMPIPDAVIEQAVPYDPTAPPVFVGHYWLRAERPERLAVNVACLDYSVARHGMLCAYRWDGEHEIDNGKFVTVPAGS